MKEKRNKKGFTLIELLAVIVILAIIALIATPIIVGVINDAKKNAFQDTGYGIMEAGKLYYASQFHNDNFNGKTFDFSQNIDELKLSGEKPGGGFFTIDKDGSQSFMIWNKDKSFCIIKDFSEKKIKMEDFGTSKCKSSSVESITGFIKDQSEKGNDGINYGAQLNKGYATFDGKSYIDAGYSRYNLENTATFVVRFMKEEYEVNNKAGCMMGNWEGAGGGLSITNTNVQFDLYINNAYKRYEAENLIPNQYYTVVGTYDGSFIYLYVNGTLRVKEALTGNIKASPVPIHIGNNPQPNGELLETFKGNLSDALILDRFVTEEEVKQYFTNEIPLIKDEKLLFQYKF